MRTLFGFAAAGFVVACWLGPPRFALGSGALWWDFLGAALRPAVSSRTGLPMWPLVLDAMGQTIALATSAVSLSLLLGMPLGVATSSWARPGPVRRSLQLAATFARSVHELIWAMLLLAAFGRSELAAVLAIAVPFMGIFAKVFADLIDGAPQGPSQGLRRAGASPLQCFVFAVLPSTAPAMTAYAFYRLECGLRSSAVLGFFGFSTLGYHLIQSIEHLRFNETWTWLFALWMLLGLADLWSSAVRGALR